jgi:hypothetical protein
MIVEAVDGAESCITCVRIYIRDVRTWRKPNVGEDLIARIGILGIWSEWKRPTPRHIVGEVHARVRMVNNLGLARILLSHFHERTGQWMIDGGANVNLDVAWHPPKILTFKQSDYSHRHDLLVLLPVLHSDLSARRYAALVLGRHHPCLRYVLDFVGVRES